MIRPSEKIRQRAMALFNNQPYHANTPDNGHSITGQYHAIQPKSLMECLVEAILEEMDEQAQKGGAEQ